MSYHQICQVCSKNPATIHEFLVAEKRDNHICDECFRKLNPDKPGPMMPIELFQKIFLSGAWAGKTKARKDLTCTTCGMTLGEFKRRGQLGCEACYQVFKKPLEALLENIHDATRHVGSRPPEGTAVQTSPVRLRQKLESLRQELERKVKAEQYEEAARLRDEIQELEQSGPKEGPSHSREET